MNSIGPALANIAVPVKSTKGVEQSAKVNGQSETKFQLPEKKSKNSGEDDIHKNELDQVENTTNNSSTTHNGDSERRISSQGAEAALLELINSYQPKNAVKSGDENDDNARSDPSDLGEANDVIAMLDDEGTAAVRATSDDHPDKKAPHNLDTALNTLVAKPGNVNQSNSNAKMLVSKVDFEPDAKSDLTENHRSLAVSSTAARENADVQGPSIAKLNLTQESEVLARKDVQNSSENNETKKAAITLNVEKAMSEGAKDQGSGKQDDRNSSSNILMVDKAGTKVTGVEVLEAKSFVAPSSVTTNANNIAQAILKSQQISSASPLQNSDPIYQTAQPKTVNTLKIQLNPAELGVVTATMKLNGDNLQVQLRVENIDAYRLLNEDSSSIVKALKGQGFGIDQINVTLASSDRGFGQQTSSQNGQSFQQHTDQEKMNNQGSNERNNRSANSNDPNGSSSITNESALIEAEQSKTYSDGVYL